MIHQSCPLCNSNNVNKIWNKVRGSDDIFVLKCFDCTLVFLSSFEHINNNFYQQSKMHVLPAKMDEWFSETETDDKRRFTTIYDITKGKNFLDFGCGNGALLKLLAPSTNLAVGVELDKLVNDYYKNNKEIKIFNSLEELKTQYNYNEFDVITLFHVLEHLPQPDKILIELSSFLKKDGKIIIEVPHSEDALVTLFQLKEYCNYTYWNCHLYFFNSNTLKLLGIKSNLKINNIKQVQRYPLSNHLYWLNKKKPGGHIHYSQLNDIELNQKYSSLLSSLGLCDTLIVSFSKKDI